MNSELQPICIKTCICKCCGANAILYDVVDFNKNCEMRRGKAYEASGIPVYYYRCSDCRFIFTVEFDHFAPGDFQRYIYNDEYLVYDPDYILARPRGNSHFLQRLFPGTKPEYLLDYGGGGGTLGQLLMKGGFAHVDIYDPFVPLFSNKPDRRYDCVVSFEVVEHSPDPRGTFEDIFNSLIEPGMIIFSTLLQPKNIDEQKLSWWYAGPRNGHVSLFSRKSLEKLITPYGFKMFSLNHYIHVLYRVIPEFAKHIIKTD